MAISYSWDFPAFECYPTYESQTDVVFTIHWRLIGDDGQGHVASVYSTQSVEYKAGFPFTAYADITPEQAQTWVTNAMGAEAVSAAESNIATQIEQQINPSSVTLPAPWAQQAA